jgi:hypothetical protein
LITWQWAPDCRPARQAGQLLGLTRLGCIFLRLDHSIAGEAPRLSLSNALRRVFSCLFHANKKAGTKAGLSYACR